LNFEDTSFEDISQDSDLESNPDADTLVEDSDKEINLSVWEKIINFFKNLFNNWSLF
jgi:hypothetical protein